MSLQLQKERWRFVNQTQKVLEVSRRKLTVREDGGLEIGPFGRWEVIPDYDPYAAAGTTYSLQERSEMTDAEGDKLAGDLVATIRKLAFCLRRAAGADNGPAEAAMNLLLRHGLLSGQEAESERRFREM
jgi:hypothetical protein